MGEHSFDLVVIGGGSGGVRAARTAAALGARVALAEEQRVGGTCVIRGCVPKKLMVLASRFAKDFEDARGFGWEMGQPIFRWNRLVDALSSEVSRLECLYRISLENSGVTIFDDRAVLEGPGLVRLERCGTLLRSKSLLLATGSEPSPLRVPGGEYCVTSDRIFSLASHPRRLVVIGGGYIAVELASALQLLGGEVTIIHRAPCLLRGFDGMLQDGVAAALMRKGARLCPETGVTRIDKLESAFVVHDTNGVKHLADCVLNATGRLPRAGGLGLEALGIDTDSAGAIVVDPNHRTTLAGVYAVGDVTNRLNLTPVAIRQGQEVAHALFGGSDLPRVHYELAPTAVFSTPELGAVGLTEGTARRQMPNLKVFKTSFRPMRATLAGSEDRIAMKVLVCGDTDKVVGVHLLGGEAAELIQLAALALQLGATKRDLDQTLAVHPTAAEELVTLRAPS